MFLIDNNQAKIHQGGEDSRACANNNGYLSTGNPLPLLPALFIGHCAMEDGDTSAKTLSDLSDELLGQGDLRDEKEGAFVLTHGIAGCPEIDLGFSAPGDTVQQENAKFSLFQGIFHLALRVLLGGCQSERVPPSRLALVPGIVSTLFSVCPYCYYRFRGFSDSPRPGERLRQPNQVQ